MGKKALCLIFAFLLSKNSFAAVVSDNDGTAFVTKSEFEALKEDFANQVLDYNNSIDGKIDGAIANYLAGVNLARKQVIDSLLNKCNNNSNNGRDTKFAWTYTKPVTQKPVSARNNFLCLMLGGYGGSMDSRRQTMLGRYGSESSINAGRTWLNNSFANNDLVCLACRKSDTGYWSVFDKYIYDVKYSVYIVGGGHGWAWGENNNIPTAGTAGVMPKSDLRWAGSTGAKADWAEMRKDATITHTITSWWSGTAGTNSFAATFQQFYEKDYDTTLNSKKVTNLGYLVDNINSTDKMYIVDDSKWHEGKDMGTTTSQNVRMSITAFSTGSYSSSQRASGEWWLNNKAFEWYNYFHDYTEINLDSLANATATVVIGDDVNYVKLYQGLPIFETPDEGSVKFTIKGKAFKTNTSDETKDDTYTGTWEGKLYLSKERFGKSTTESNYESKNDTHETNYITLSNTNSEKEIEINVKKGERYWVKFIPTTTTDGLKIQLETKDDVIFTGQ